MFNPNHSQQLQTSIMQAINDLIVQSKTNTQSILEHQTHIQTFKQTLKALQDSSNVADAEDSPATLEQSRSHAIQEDCQTLTVSIDQISSNLSKKNTKQALDLIDPFIKNSQLLKTRVEYIHELEQLLSDFEQEKQVRSRLQKVAAALDLSIDMPAQTTVANNLPNTFSSHTTLEAAQKPVPETEVSTATATEPAQKTEDSTTTYSELAEKAETSAITSPESVEKTEVSTTKPEPAKETVSETELSQPAIISSTTAAVTETPPSYARHSFLSSETSQKMDNTADKAEKTIEADQSVSVQIHMDAPTPAQDKNWDKAEGLDLDLSHNSVLELEKLLNPEPKTLNSTDKLDFNKIDVTAIGSSSKHKDILQEAADPLDSFELDEDTLSGKTLQDDLDSLLLEAEMLEKQANLKRSSSTAGAYPLSTSFLYK
ncbi:hypothetical protein [Thiofilum flexile]|uniref:hypothetical protein n=1 Tax=Thiofilum flexile TaxID=125627 RepID=UPI00036C63CD|nr:hypothetical protein [Thiofilum flexile]